jgi:hypothetical protein
LVNYSQFNNPITTSTTGTISSQYTVYAGLGNTIAITTAGTGSGTFDYCKFTSGSASCITIGAGTAVTATNCELSSSNTNVITGAGTISYQNLSYLSSSSNINTTTQTVLSSGPSKTIGSANTGVTNTLLVSNSSNTASSRANISASVGGTSSEDGSFSSVITGGQTWSWGGDNSDSDAFVISANASLGTTNVMRVATTGEINYPLQSAFLGISTGTTDCTGDGTNVSPIVLATEVFDQNSDFASSVYTAPITGRVLLSMNVTYVQALAATQIYAGISTSNRTYQLEVDTAATALTGNANYFVPLSVLADMDAGDTANIYGGVSGLTKTVDIVSPYTFFSGYIAC